MSRDDTAIAVFTRAIVPGATKTRLVPLLGADGAARAHAALLRIALRAACAACPGRVTMFVAGDRPDDALQALAAEHRVPLQSQQGDDLGARMQDALARLLAGHRRALLIGSDCATLTAACLHDAARQLDGHDMVFVPAEDGGYVLVGAAGDAARLAPAFADVAWGTAAVMSTTRRRLRDAGLRHVELPTAWDVDEPADWQRALREGLVEPV